MKKIGYDDPEIGIDYKTCEVMVRLHEQSPDISGGVTTALEHRDSGETHDEVDTLGAGDQGMMFGYATDETDVLMPAPITYAHRLVKRQSEVRKNGTLAWLQPDAKSQITFRYEDGKPVAIDAVVLSTQHREDISLKALQEAVMEEIIKPAFSASPPLAPVKATPSTANWKPEIAVLLS